MKQKNFKKNLSLKSNNIIAIYIIFLFFTMAYIPNICGYYKEIVDYKINNKIKFKDPSINEDGIDIDYVYSIIQNLSYIIFTEYNESAGELAKGRGFGTKGEHKAAEILYENMTNMGLITTKERLNNTEKYPNLIKGYNVLDYGLTLKNETSKEALDCYINAIKLKNPIHEKIVNLSFNNTKIKIMPNTTFGWFKALINDRKEGKYVFLSDIRSVYSRDPNASLSLDSLLLRKMFYPIQNPCVFYNSFKKILKKEFLKICFKNCVGTITYDFTNDTHNKGFNTNGELLANVIINGTNGRKILNDYKNYKVDFYIKEMYNKSIESYNVIGLLEGTDKNKTVIVDCLYDSVWSQGTGDAAIGMGIVMGVAKYFQDHNIHPKCNIKFIGFGGEEAGLLGAIYYEDTHQDEKITHIIDLNQVCSSQKNPPLTLNVVFNKLSFMWDIWPIIEKSNYTQRVNNTDIAKRWWPSGNPSDDRVFNMNRWLQVKTVSFLEDFPWIAHHRDGLNHTAGDVFDHVDWNEVKVVGEIVINILQHLTVEPESIRYS